jgi:hypothetical protein
MSFVEFFFQTVEIIDGCVEHNENIFCLTKEER